MTHKGTRSIYIAFEFEKDKQRRVIFISQAHQYSDYILKDLSLPSAVHDVRWQREAIDRIQKSDVVIVLLGPDTHNAPGVLDELSLAGQVKCPIVQLLPQRKKYGLVSQKLPICKYKWKRINEMLDEPNSYH